MIISRTPLRISFVGGGSDISSFYKTTPGAVVSTTINKYVYITLNKRFDGRIRVCYSNSELVDNVSDIKHRIARETLKYFKIKNSIEVTSIGDIPAGTGLGSSGAYTVGLIHTLSEYKGLHLTAKKIAEYASHIEIKKVDSPIGKQDQYASAYGGFNFIEFYPDESVVVKPIRLSSIKQKYIESNLLLFYTGKKGSSTKVLSKQNIKIGKRVDQRAILSQMVRLARDLKKELLMGNIDSFGELLHENWLLKKKMGNGISNAQIDEWYDTALRKGAIGGKICGAGGRGFLLLYAPMTSHKKIISALSNLQRESFAFEKKGSTIIYNQ